MNFSALTFTNMMSTTGNFDKWIMLDKSFLDDSSEKTEVTPIQTVDSSVTKVEIWKRTPRYGNDPKIRIEKDDNEQYYLYAENGYNVKTDNVYLDN